MVDVIAWTFIGITALVAVVGVAIAAGVIGVIFRK